MYPINLETFRSLFSETLKHLSTNQIVIFILTFITLFYFFSHRIKSINFPLKKVSVQFLYDDFFGRLFLTEEGATIWNLFCDPYKSNLNKENIVIKAHKLLKNEVKLKNYLKKIKNFDDKQLKNYLESDEWNLYKKYINTVPIAKLYKNLLLQGYCVCPNLLLNLNNFEIKENDVCIISYPRSGTTWTEEILSTIYTQQNIDILKKQPIHFRVIHLEVGRPFGQLEWLNSIKSPRLLATHLPYSHVPEQLKQLKCKIIYVARNFKDQAVSYYHFHQTAKYLGGKKWDWSEYLKLYEKGDLVYGSWFDHILPWYELSMKHPKKLMFLTYEQLNQNLELSIKQISEFLNKPIDNEYLKKTVKHCSFDQMKNNDAVNRVNIPLSSFIDQSEIKFMRKGKIGDWQNYFNEKENNHFDELYHQKIKSKGIKFAFTEQQAKQYYC